MVGCASALAVARANGVDVVNLAKWMAQASGVPRESAAGHSFRRGGATWAFQSGVPEVLVQRQGDWRSGAYKEYIELSPERALSTTKSMFAQMGVTEFAWQGARMTAAEDPGDHQVVGMGA